LKWLGLIGRLRGRARGALPSEDKFEPTFEQSRAMWRQRWLSALQHFADTDTQRRWLDTSEHNPHYSYVECMACYFDDAFFPGHEIDRWVSLGYMIEAEYVAMSPFHRLVESYRPPNNDPYDCDAILADARWGELVRSAQNVQATLVALISEPTELAALKRPRDWIELDGGGYRSSDGSFIVSAS